MDVPTTYIVNTHLLYRVMASKLAFLLAAMPLYTPPRIVVGVGVEVGVRVGVGVGVKVDHFIFTRKRLGGISSNFAYAFLYC